MIRLTIANAIPTIVKARDIFNENIVLKNESPEYENLHSKHENQDSIGKNVYESIRINRKQKINKPIESI